MISSVLFLCGSGSKIWVFILLLIIINYIFGNPLKEDFVHNIEYIAEEVLSFIIIVVMAATAFALMGGIFLVLFKQLRPKDKKPIKSSDSEQLNKLPDSKVNAARTIDNEQFDLDFVDNPQDFDRKIIEFVGRVESILEIDYDYVEQSKIIAMQAQSERVRGVSSHQRFFLSSPFLKKNEALKVFNNTSFGALDLKEGDWVHLKGEYIHASELGQYYGRVHYVHEPVGFIKIVEVDKAYEFVRTKGLKVA